MSVSRFDPVQRAAFENDVHAGKRTLTATGAEDKWTVINGEERTVTRGRLSSGSTEPPIAAAEVAVKTSPI